MKIDLGGIVIVTGNYGSGKTEVSVNLAVENRARGIDVRLADLDLVNPYFRSREARHQLRDLGIEVILPHEQYMAADLPILVPEVAGAIREQKAMVILDVGGDDVGATVLAALADRLKRCQREYASGGQSIPTLYGEHRGMQKNKNGDRISFKD